MDARVVKKKKNFSDMEIETLTYMVAKNSVILFGSLKSGVKCWQKKAVWKEIAAALNSVGHENRTAAEVKKKWSDLKVATKKSLAALKQNTSEEGHVSQSLQLTETEERIAALLESPAIRGVTMVITGGGGDTDAPPPVSMQDIKDESEPGTNDIDIKDESEPGTSVVVECLPVPQSPRRERTSTSSRAVPPRPWILTQKVLQKQEEMCQSMAEINRSLLAINDTLKAISESLAGHKK